ncbi:MAG TPA: selenium-binding protein SBP56-related protein [Kofleriaceae bacterium]|nr:selenium-binding protein SBP56-related protein [Kofleriaceae bacterium]
MRSTLATRHLLVALSVGLAIPACAGVEGGEQTDDSDLDETESFGGTQERYMYIATISQSSTDPDFVAVVGVNPTKSDFGKIIKRVDMPNIGDELHHFGYSLDQDRLIVPGLFSGRIHVFNVENNPANPTLVTVNNNLVSSSGYIVPHTVVGLPGGLMGVTMIGGNTADSTPGGVVLINDHTGNFSAYYGPPPTNRPAGTIGPKYMYDIDGRIEANRLISTTFGPPGLCGGGLDPTCLGNEVAVWNILTRKVVQIADLGTNSGALEVRFIEKFGTRRALLNTAGTSGVWLADDDDGNGVYDFQQVLGPEDGLLIPADMLLSYDNKYMYLSNWFGNTVQQFDITDPFNPVLVDTVDVPHPNMLRLSRDNKRLFVTNSLITTWDNDPDFGPPRNNDYGLWLFDVDHAHGGMTSRTPSGGPITSFTSVQKKTTTGPAGPHMMFFDPSIQLTPGEH